MPNQFLRFRKQSDWEREDSLIFLFFLGLISFPKPCVNIGAKNYMAYIKERREYYSALHLFFPLEYVINLGDLRSFF